MKQLVLILSVLSCQIGLSQNQKGIAFQAVARSSYGVIMPNKQMQIRISLLKDTLDGNILYQEIKSIVTNPLGLFSILIGAEEPTKIITMGNFEKINWTTSSYFIRVEIDPDNRLQFIRIGQQQIQYAAYAFSADHVLAENVEGVLSIEQGGTSVNNLSAFKLALQIDKVNNIPDSAKMVSKATSLALNNKLDKKDTVNLSNRINQKLNKGEISRLEITSSLGFTPFEMHFGAFSDTTKQFTIANTATAIKWRDTIQNSQLYIGLNSSLEPTKLVVAKAGIYLVQYALQVSNPMITNDEISVWIRRNGAAYTNSLRQFLTGAVGVKNIFSGQSMIPLGEDDYLELLISTKHSQTQLLKTSNLSNPSRPATPSAHIMLFRIQ